MPKLAYSNKKPGPRNLAAMYQARDICIEYANAGLSLTLRQLYYQHVARGIIANKQSEYKRLGGIVDDARMLGIIDWNHLEDRTRNIDSIAQFRDARDFIHRATEHWFHTNWWEGQDVHVEVWVEKEALAGIVEDMCRSFDVTSLACRGYLSQSEAWTASQRFLKHIKAGRRCVVVHLGDHDPSGMDMSRDNEDRIWKFLHHDIMRVMPDENTSRSQVLDFAREQWGTLRPMFELERIALNMDQVQTYNPPPNPAKVTDSRFEKYEEAYGDESWELDALPPDLLTSLITDAIESYMEPDAFEEAKEREAIYRDKIRDLLLNHGSELAVV